MQPLQIVEQLADVLGRRVTLRAAGEPADAEADFPYGDEGGALRIAGPVRSALSVGERAAIDAAAHLLDMASGASPGARRSRVFAALIAADSSARRDALWELRARRWIDGRADGIDVIAVVLDAAPELRIVAFGRRLAGALRGTVQFVGAHRGAAIFVASRTLDTEGVSVTVEAEAAGLGLTARGLALAAGSPDDDDLDDTVSRAIRSAHLRATLPGQVASLRAEDLGGWALVQTLPRSRSLLVQACPAAFVLASADDQTQRETIEAYLDAAGRATVACQALHIHRTTLYYRLEQMPEVVREALTDGLQRSTLHLTLKLLRLWDEELRRGEPGVSPVASRRDHVDVRMPA
jgi:hypothetical protein